MFNYALVSLDLSLILLQQRRHVEVRKVAEEMLEIFKRFDVGRDAMMAIRVFWEAAKQEVATVDLTKKVFRFFLRADSDPGLLFEEIWGAGS